MTKAYIVEELDGYGYVNSNGYFFQEKDALKAMRELIAIRKTKDSWVKNADLERKGRNGTVKKLTAQERKDKFKESILYEAICSHWYQTSYEYDEHDITSWVIVLREIVIN